MKGLAGILLALAFSTAAIADVDVTVTDDKLYGACSASDIIGKFFGRYPPKSTRVELEIDLTVAGDEIFVYYKDQAPEGRLIAFFSAETCEFLREEKPLESRNNV